MKLLCKGKYNKSVYVWLHNYKWHITVWFNKMKSQVTETTAVPSIFLSPVTLTPTPPPQKKKLWRVRSKEKRSKGKTRPKEGSEWREKKPWRIDTDSSTLNEFDSYCPINNLLRSCSFSSLFQPPPPPRRPLPRLSFQMSSPQPETQVSGSQVFAGLRNFSAF